MQDAKKRQKFLLIRFSSIGDIVLTTPAIRCLRKTYPDADIHFLTKKAFKSILEPNPYLNKILTLEDSLQACIDEVKKEEYDAILDLHHNLRTLSIRRNLKGIPFYSFQKLNVKKWIFTTFKINTLPRVHIVQRYLETMIPLGVLDDGGGLDYFIPEEHKVKDEDIPFSHSQGYVALVIGAAHNTKKLPMHKIKALAGELEFPIILLGGKEDADAGNEIASVDTVKIYNACGKFSLHESADLVRRSSLVITHDTGMMHIAAAFKKQILSVWGNTVPAFGMTPYRTSYDVFEVKGLWCRPCSKTGFEKCPLGHFKCMEKQEMPLIAQRALDILNAGTERRQK